MWVSENPSSVIALLYDIWFWISLTSS
jgi:hypothetical protein